MPPHPGEFPLLEDPEELGLGGQGEFPHLVQEDGALVGHLEEAGLPSRLAPVKAPRS